MSRVRDKADFQFAGEDYTHGSGVKYVANMIQTTDLTASGTITDIHLSDISDMTAPTSGNDGHYLKYDHGTTSFVWGAGGGGGGGLAELVDDTTPQLGGNLDINGQEIQFGINSGLTGDKLKFGSSYGDLEIFQDSNRSHIRSTEIWIEQPSGNRYFTAGSGQSTNLHDTNSTARVSVSTTGVDITGDMTVTGDFTVNGTTTTINTTELTVSDNIITLNNDETGTPSQNAGIAVERGTSDNVDIRWNETSDKWEFTNDGATYSDIGSGDTGDISFSGSTITSSGATVTVDDNLTVTGNFTSSQAGAPILTSASSLTLQASDRVHVNQSPLRLYNVSTTNRNALTAADGDMVYDSTLNETYAYHNGSWTSLSGGGGGGSATDILTITTTSSIPPTAPSSGSVNIYEDGSTLTFQNSRAGTGHYQMKMENSAGTFLFGVDGLGNAVTGTTGSVRTKYFYSVTNTSYYMDPSSTGTALQLAGNIKTDGSYIGNIIEESIAASSTSGGINFYVKTYQIMRFTQAQTANRTLNITGDVSTTLDSHLVNDQFVSIAVAFKNGGTPYYINSVTIDGASVTPKWSGGSAPTGGNASSDDFYTFSIVKTGSATFEVYGTFTQFA